MKEWVAIVDLPTHPTEVSDFALMLLSPSGEDQAFISNIQTLAPQFTGNENYWSFMHASAIEINTQGQEIETVSPMRFVSPRRIGQISITDYAKAKVGDNVVVEYNEHEHSFTIISTKKVEEAIGFWVQPSVREYELPLDEPIDNWKIVSGAFTAISSSDEEEGENAFFTDSYVGTTCSVSGTFAVKNKLKLYEGLSLIKVDGERIYHEINHVKIPSGIEINNSLHVGNAPPPEPNEVSAVIVPSTTVVTDPTATLSIPWELSKHRSVQFLGLGPGYGDSFRISKKIEEENERISIDNAPLVDFTMSAYDFGFIYNDGYSRSMIPYPSTQLPWGGIEWDGAEEAFKNNYARRSFIVSGYVKFWNYLSQTDGLAIPKKAYLKIAIETSNSGIYKEQAVFTTLPLKFPRGTSGTPQKRDFIALSFSATVYVEKSRHLKIVYSYYPTYKPGTPYSILQDAKTMLVSRNVENRLQISYTKC